MAIFSVLLASFFIASSNLFMRRSLDAGGTTKTFLVIQMFVAFLASLLLGPIQSHSYSTNLPVVGLGLLSGIVLALMLLFLGKSLEKGPPGLTFSILSSASVMPAIVLALIFGSAYGFFYTPWHAIGSVLVLIGLFWAGKGLAGMRDRPRWIQYSGTMFSLHVLLLVIFQWRGAILSQAESWKSVWFMPMIYLGAASIQLAIFLKTEKRSPNPKEWFYGLLGGLCNCLCTFFLIRGTEQASGLQSAVIFPLYSIGTIVLSNLWGQRLYAEKVNWRAAQICLVGILIGTVDWKLIGSFFNAL